MRTKVARGCWLASPDQRGESRGGEVLAVFFFQAEDGIRDDLVTGVQTCALPICSRARRRASTAAEVLAPAEKLFVERGCCRETMNMVLVGAEFALARSETVLGDFCVPSLEIAGPGGHWVEVSRAIGAPSAEVQTMLEAYEEYYETAKDALKSGATAHDVHRMVSKGFTD